MAPKHLRVVASLFVAVAAGGCTASQRSCELLTGEPVFS